MPPKRNKGGRLSSRESESDDEGQLRHFKIVVLGDGAVGKTSICHRFTEEKFSYAYKQTIGLDFFLKRLVLPGDIQVALQIWDIGGQTLGSKMLKRYIAGADAILFTYDITNYQSFQNLEDWVRVVTQTNEDKIESEEDQLPYFALLGNKSDLSHLRTVRMQKHTQFASENEMSSFLLSAKTGDQVATTFFKIAADLAGVALTKPDTQVRTKVVKAELVDHEKDDPKVKEPDLHKQRKCTIQ